MLGFIIPVKPKAYSKNWHLDNLLLERTLRSVCNQEDTGFKVVVVYTDKPDIKFCHSQVSYLYFPYNDIAATKMTDWEVMQQWYSPVFAERMMDKGRKILLGCRLAQNLGCTYLMGVDSDDLVSNQLASFINNSTEIKCPGWRVTKGYVYEDNAHVAIKNHRIWGMNGSTHIISADLVTIPDFETDHYLFHYTLFQSHAFTYQRLIDYNNVRLRNLPFYGVIYLVHDNNYSGIREILTTDTAKILVKKILKGKLVTRKLRKEFSLYPLSEICPNNC